MEEAMTPIQFADAMRRIARESAGDIEDDHIKMDELMSRTLALLGYGEGVKVFDEMHKWYA